MSTVARPKIESKIRQFQSLTLIVVEMAARENIRIRPFTATGVPYFAALRSELQDHVLWQLETFIACGRELQDSARSVSDARLLTAAFIRRNHWQAPADFTERIGPDDCVDIYNENHQLIFANLRFFEILSYSLEDLYCRPWMDLFRREDHQIHTRLIEIVTEVLSGRSRQTYDLSHLPKHIAYEALAPKVGVAETTPKAMAPLWSDGRVKGYACVNDIRPFC